MQGNETSTFSVGRWIRANAIGLGLTYGLFALLGDLAEYGLGVVHDSPLRGVALFIALGIGATTFVELRRRALLGHVHRPRWIAVASGIGLMTGLIVGQIVAGPPFDFVLGAVTLGTIGGALQWRSLRQIVPNPGGLLVSTVLGWLAAGMAVAAVAIVAGDPIHRMFGAPPDGTVLGTVVFVLLLTLLGVVGGMVGGAIEGRSLRSRLASLHASMTPAQSI